MATNMAFPGFGTLFAGRFISGILQSMISLGGLALSTIYLAPMISWMLKNWGRLNDPAADPVETLNEIVAVLKWPVTGILLFAFAWLWALCSSYFVLQQTRSLAAQHLPPPLDRR